jgi:hypothetical protein
MWETGDVGRSTTYWVRQNGRQRRSNRDLALYADRASKLDPNQKVAHLELRFLNAGAVRRAGLANPKDLIRLDPSLLFEQNIQLVDFNFATWQRAVIKAAVNADRATYRSKTTSRFVDMYRAALPRRVLSFLVRSGCDRVQRAKDLQPKYLRACTTIPIEVMQIPDRLSWPTSP